MKKSKITAVLLAAFMALSAVPLSAAADWETKNGNKIYISDDGKMLKGFQTIGGKKYYFDKDGYMTTGWLTFKGSKYYFSSKGVMYTGWMTIKKSGKKYYFDTDGKMAVGLKSIEGEKYYFTKDGTMKTGWHELSDGTRYYFKKDGTMARDCTLKIGGKKYTFKSNGKLKTSSSSSSSSSDSSSSSKKPSKFSAPEFGKKPSVVLKNCGIGEYSYSKESNIYSGTTYFAGKKAKLSLLFNSNDQLYSYFLDIEESYSTFTAYLDVFIDTLGSDYTYENDSYFWTDSTSGVLIAYNNSKKSIQIVVIDYTYCDQ